ncbi:neuropeptide FF receptor 1 like 2 [Halichoeres trimaculatus]|uniref:neuropeptide FF receptor 1 like 2 n=1 Tax=Halichoeres trimaculatus TaxID=147232 RepID=UPI003D9E60A8
METVSNMGEEGMELEGSAITEAFMNTSFGNATTNVTTNITTNITFLSYYQHSLYVAVSYILAYFFIFLLCMVGNILVCLIILENHRMRTVNNLFILNLAVSDLLVGIFCIPTTLVDNLITGWPFSNTTCKMSGFVQGVSVSTSVFTLVAIAVERFRCIVFPLQPKLTTFVAKAAIVFIWMLAVVIMCPAAMALTVADVPFHYLVHNNDFNNTLPLYTCFENFSNPKMSRVYTAVLFVHIYLIPLSVITLMYSSIGVKLCSTVVANREPQLANATVQAGGRRGGQQMISKKKIRVIKMLFVVTLLFMLSWLPLWTLMMMADFAGLDRDQLDILTSYVFPFAHWLAFANSSINPIIYGYYNENFKRGFQAVCKSRSCFGLWQCQLWRRIPGWRRKERSVQTPCEDAGFRDGNGNHNHIVVGIRNRVHNDSKMDDSAESDRGGKMGCVAVHLVRSISDQGLEMANIQKKNKRKSTSVEEADRVSAGAVYHAWDE